MIQNEPHQLGKPYYNLHLLFHDTSVILCFLFSAPNHFRETKWGRGGKEEGEVQDHKQFFITVPAIMPCDALNVALASESHIPDVSIVVACKMQEQQSISDSQQDRNSQQIHPSFLNSIR